MSSTPPPPSPAPAPDRAVLERVIVEAEAHLTAQLTAALAADQRALVFAGFLAAAGAGLIGSAAVFLVGSAHLHELGRVAMGTGSMMLVAVLLAVLAARPITFWFVGNDPEMWEDDIANCRRLEDCLPEVIDDLKRRIKLNAKSMKRNGVLLNAAIWMAFGALVVGAIAVLNVVGAAATGTEPTANSSAHGT